MGDEFARVAYLVLLLIAVGGFLLVELRERPGKTLRMVAAWGLIFLGAIAAMRRNMHMGFDLVVTSVSPGKRRVLLTIANGLVLAVCLLILTGTIMQWHVNATNIAPVTRMPMIWVFGVAVPMAGAVGIMAGLRMLGYATGRLSDAPVHIDPELHQ